MFSFCQLKVALTERDVLVRRRAHKARIRLTSRPIMTEKGVTGRDRDGVAWLSPA
jgi:hypothetical protein